MTPEDYAVELLGDDDVLERVERRTAEAGLPAIAVRPVYGRLLTLLVAASGAHRILEIGTLGGYSAICMARGTDERGRILSLELDASHARVAERNLREAGYADRVEVRVGPAAASIEALAAAGERFQFFFIDADKESYPRYLEGALRLAERGALIVADNALFHGRVLDPQDGSEAARALRSFNQAAASHPRLTALLLPAYDGLMVARVTA